MRRVLVAVALVAAAASRAQAARTHPTPAQVPGHEPPSLQRHLRPRSADVCAANAHGSELRRHVGDARLPRHQPGSGRCYNPDQLRVLSSCHAAAGTVTKVKSEEDATCTSTCRSPGSSRACSAARTTASRTRSRRRVHGTRRGTSQPLRSATASGSRALKSTTQTTWNSCTQCGQSPSTESGVVQRTPFRSSPADARPETGSRVPHPSRKPLRPLRALRLVKRRIYREAQPGGGGSGGSPPSGGGDKNCYDFSTQPETQTYFKSKSGPAQDPDGLDGDRDEIACENLPPS